MLFHAWIFPVFFLVFYPIYLLVKKSRFKEPWLLAASYVFYGWWNPLYLLIIAWATTLDFLMVVCMDRFGRRKLWLGVSVANSLALLGFFKYGSFVVANINHLLAACGIPYVLPKAGVLLPVGISFYVFQSMGYVIDCYFGRIEREKNFIRYAAFVSLFPQLLAGPIERAGRILPQLRLRSDITARDIADGMSLFLVGLFKKIALADYFALYVDQVFGLPNKQPATALLLAVFLFSWQIYFDFSGYSDMARGIARLMGIRLMVNFNNPYMATGLGDFWRRWHISLSTWMRDYLFLPLFYSLSRRLERSRIGRRSPDALSYAVSISVTWTLLGLWHGANWIFVIWGGLHAAGRIAARKLENSVFYRKKVPRFIKRLWVFVFVSLTWIFFRPATIGDAKVIVSRIFTANWGDPRIPLLMLLLVMAVGAYQVIFESRRRAVLESSPLKIALIAGIILYLIVFVSSTNQPFIYFQF